MAILPNTMYSTISDDKPGIAPVVASAITVSGDQAFIPAMAILPNAIHSTISDGKPGIAPVVSTAIAVSGSDQVLVTIKNSPRDVNMSNASAAPPYKKLYGFARVRAGSSFIDTCPLYETISVDSDYRKEFWDDSQYRLHMRPLVNEEEWMQLKKDILQIYSEQNAKRMALRKLIMFNSYRSMFHMLIAAAENAWNFYDRCVRCVIKNDPLRDPQAFLEAVMTAHPDLDPVLVEEELIQQLRQLADNFTSRHPGVYCRFTSILGHYKTKKGRSYYETFQIQFLKFVPNFQV
eukprot:gene24057-32471_t